MTAGQKDGILGIHDMRMLQPIAKERIHGGAINMLEPTLSNLIITGAADKLVKKIDMNKGFKPVSQMQATDAIFCGEILHNLAITGCGDGSILVYDLDQEKCLYGYGADSTGAVHCLKVMPDHWGVVTGGDGGFGLKICFT